MRKHNNLGGFHCNKEQELKKVCKQLKSWLLQKLSLHNCGQGLPGRQSDPPARKLLLDMQYDDVTCCLKYTEKTS